jgi:hypothetical protein
MATMQITDRVQLHASRVGPRRGPSSYTKPAIVHRVQLQVLLRRLCGNMAIVHRVQLQVLLRRQCGNLAICVPCTVTSVA